MSLKYWQALDIVAEDWCEHRFPLPPEARRDIEGELKKRAVGTPEQRADFLRAVEAALGLDRWYRAEPPKALARRRDEVEAIAKVAQKLLRLVEQADADESRLHDALCLPLCTGAPDDAGRWLAELCGHLRTLEGVARLAAGMLKPKRPGPRAGGPERQLVGQLADAWFWTFDARPTPWRSGSFAAVLDLVAAHAGFDEGTFGESLLKGVLRRDH